MSARTEMLAKKRMMNLRWWYEEEGKAHQALFSLLDTIRARPEYQERRRQFLLFLSLYTNMPVLGFGLQSYARSYTGTRISLNVIQNCINTLVSKVARTKPKPNCITEEGNYEAQEKAKGMQDSIDGILYEKRFYNTHSEFILDACVYGTGVLKIYEDPSFGDVRIDRTFIWELVIDDREAIYGKPRTITQRKYYDKDVLCEQFAKAKDYFESESYQSIMESISGGSVDADSDEFDYDPATNQICVYESWHLKSGKDADDGKHMVAIRGCDLLFEDYDEDDFPFVFLRPCKAPMGFYGVGTCETLAGMQAEINRILRDIQDSMHLLAKPHWMVEYGSKVVKQHFNNDIATIIGYSGAQPTVYTPQAMSGDVYNHLQFLYKTAYEISGISQLSAQSQKPAGLNSGVALRAMNDIESERFLTFIDDKDESIRSVVEKVVSLIRKLSPKNKGGYEVTAITKGGLKKINWSDVDLENDTVIRIQPSSMLPSTIPGKLAFVDDLRQIGEITPDQALELIGFPDTEEFTKQKTAPSRAIKRDIAAMLRGVGVMPEPFDDHQLAKVLVNDAYHEARVSGVPEDNLEFMRKYIVATIDFINGGAEQSLPGVQGPTGTPQINTPGQPGGQQTPPVGPPAPVGQATFSQT